MQSGDKQLDKLDKLIKEMAVFYAEAISMFVRMEDKNDSTDYSAKYSNWFTSAYSDKDKKVRK